MTAPTPLLLCLYCSALALLGCTGAATASCAAPPVPHAVAVEALCFLGVPSHGFGGICNKAEAINLKLTLLGACHLTFALV